ncbi:DUF2249 domain-containing protein [Devosia sp. RR2S18]|uniref:DUF2249 domain-containing protein n=1 Tax=Devosia rhizosphaerae TaxID=3049774 RepID=UPI002541C5B9|nr:DUF2249 domain-containing protein [Devosia sp. RR2S18]WIJ26901.1 DUF2249 domain-containing protein [Devosia sp. RR2S18]
MNDLELDVRPILRNGGEPFSAIMGAVNALAAGQRLRLFVTFRPEPLFEVMAKKGFSNEAMALQGGDWQIVFTPTAAKPPGGSADNPNTWDDPKHYLDCTEMELSEAETIVLDRLASMPEGEVLFAIFMGEPTSFFSTLKGRGHAQVGDFAEDGQTYRLLIRSGGRS